MYGGLICIINYVGIPEGTLDDFALITQDGVEITTQLSVELLATEEV